MAAGGAERRVVREIGLTDEERSGLEACADVTLITVADATHGLIIEQPARIAGLILELVENKTLS